MVKEPHTSGTATQGFLATEVAKFKASQSDYWRKHRWGLVTMCGGAATIALSKLITGVIMPRLPFTPYYTLQHDDLAIFEQIMLGNKAAVTPLFSQVTLYNYVIQVSIALAVGAGIGFLVTKRPSLAAFIAVLPNWILLTVSSLFSVYMLSSLYDLPRGREFSTADASISVLTSTIILAAAVIGSLIGWHMQRKATA